jgi:glycerol-3-phosphate dehydrogenase (NAD(P)+)
MKISVLGCGRWGSFLAWYQATVLKNKVIVCGEEGRASYEILRETGKNEYVTLDKSIQLTSDLGFALKESDVIIISISAQALRSYMQKVIKFPVQDNLFVLCM